MELLEPLLQFEFDAGDRLQQRRPRRHIVRIGIDFDEFQLVGLLPGERIEFVDRIPLRRRTATPARRGPRNAPEKSRWRRRAPGTSRDRNRRQSALVLQRHQIGDELALVQPLAALDGKSHRRIGLDRADAVDAGHRGDDDDVVALQQRPRRRVAHAVDLFVDRGILLDIGVGARDIGFGLVVVVIADEIFDGVVGKEIPELAIELRRQRLVGRQDQRRALRRLDHLGHGEGLAGAGDAEQHLGAVVPAHAFDQILDRRRLIALGIEIGFDHQRAAAFGFVRPRRAVRRPQLPLAEFVAALAQQAVERLLAGGAAERSSYRPAPASPSAAGASGLAGRRRLKLWSRPRRAPRCRARGPDRDRVRPAAPASCRHSPAAAPRRNRAPPTPAPDAHWRNRRGGPRSYPAAASDRRLAAPLPLWGGVGVGVER